jgi:hypothetical protein
MGRTFEVRYEEHIQAIRTNTQNPKYAPNTYSTQDTHTVQSMRH